MPATVARLEVRVDEPFPERATGTIEHRQDGEGRPTELVPACLELEELGQREAARRYPVTGALDVDGLGDPDLQVRDCERAVAVAQERERGRIVLPEQLECAARGAGGG